MGRGLLICGVSIAVFVAIAVAVVVPLTVNTNQTSSRSGESNRDGGDAPRPGTPSPGSAGGPTLSPVAPGEPRPASKCFESRDELIYNLNQYFDDPTGTNTAETYGHPLNNWCVGKVTDFSAAFAYPRFMINEPLDQWDVSNAINMEDMFNEAVFNEDISSWDVSKVRNMRAMFAFADWFNQDISSWNVSNVVDISGMFLSADSFNQSLCAWGDRLPDNLNTRSNTIFASDSCPDPSPPDMDAEVPGPFCYPCGPE